MCFVLRVNKKSFNDVNNASESVALLKKGSFVVLLTLKKTKSRIRMFDLLWAQYLINFPQVKFKLAINSDYYS